MEFISSMIDDLKSAPKGVWIGLVVFIVVVFGISALMTYIRVKRLNAEVDAQNPAGTDSGNGDASANTVANVNNNYYRWQPDNQIVLERTPQQKRIVDEYFIIKNIKTTVDKKPLLAISILGFAAGVILLLIGLIKGVKPCIVIGVIALVLGVAFAIAYAKTKKTTVRPSTVMTDAEYEKLVRERIQELKVQELGLEKLGLDSEQVKEIKPIIFSGKVIDGTSLVVDSEETHKLYSSTQYVTLLYFTDEQLFIYKIQFDMCCNMQKEWTNELFYVDICDVSSKTENNILAIGTEKIEYSSLNVSIVATNSEMSFSLDGTKERLASIQAMKQKIREKKM